MRQEARVTENSQELRNAAYNTLAAAKGLLPIKVTAFYQKKVDAEVEALGHHNGPLARVVYPSQERLTLRAPGEVADWVDDRTNMPKGADDIFIQKYADRVLFTPTATCAAHCLYCFRQDVLSHQKKEKPLSLEEQLDVLEAHLKVHPEASEVILSGGDPLTLATDSLALIFERLRAINTVKNIRIHTRVPVFSPAALKSDDKIKLFAEHDARVIIHAVHPYEICNEVGDTLSRMASAGVRLYNQFPLLRGTNDHAAVLIKLIERLESFHTRTLSLFVPEPIFYSAAYRISWRRMCALIDAVIQHTPAWMHAFRFSLDSPYGKVQRADLIMHDRTGGRLIFKRGDKRFAYPDFPEIMDAPGDIATMLWKE